MSRTAWIVLAASLIALGLAGTIFLAMGGLMMRRVSTSAAPSSAPARPPIEIGGLINRHVPTAPGTCLVELTITNNTGRTIRDLRISRLSLDGNPPIGVRLPLRVHSLAPGASHQMRLTFRSPSRYPATLQYDIGWSWDFWGFAIGHGSASGSEAVWPCR
jgi:hypothetical protein